MTILLVCHGYIVNILDIASKFSNRVSKMSQLPAPKKIIIVIRHCINITFQNWIFPVK